MGLYMGLLSGLLRGILGIYPMAHMGAGFIGHKGPSPPLSSACALGNSNHRAGLHQVYLEAHGT